MRNRKRGTRSKRSWRRFDPDEIIYGALDLMPNRRQAFAYGSLFVGLKWASFASSINDLILQSKPVKWLAGRIGFALENALPTLHPVFSHLAEFINGWARLWRTFVSPIYRFLSIFRLFHVPEILVAIATDLLVLFGLPLVAFAASWLASRQLRIEVARYREVHERKINQLEERDPLHARIARAEDWMQLYGHAKELYWLANVMNQKTINQRKAKLSSLPLNDTSPRATSERQKLQDEIIRLGKSNELELLAQASVADLLAAQKDTDTLGTRTVFVDKEDLVNFADYVRGKHLGLMFADKETVSNNLRLLQAQHGLNFQVFRAVAMSMILAISAVVLRIIGQILF